MAAINFFLICSLVFYTCNASATFSSSPLPKFPAILVFGDSVVDTGNNNYIKTWVKANYPPYGQDYSDHLPTGRFSNGKLLPDMLASILGIKDSVPPFLNPTLSEKDLITGVNFASAGSGFDDLTSAIPNVVSFSTQIQLFKEYIERLKGIAGEVKAMEIINRALVIINAGTNDWVNFYDIPKRKLHFNASEYQDFELSKLHGFIKELYKSGCRAMIISGLPPIGCLPVQRTPNVEKPAERERHCLEDQNRDCEAYNQKLVKLLPEIQATLPGTKIGYNDVYEIFVDIIIHPQKYGFEETTKGCCASGPLHASQFCDTTTPTCENPSKFVFWDMIHPTQTAYEYLVTQIVNTLLPNFL